MNSTSSTMRARLLPLWIAVFAQALAEAAVRIFVLRVVNSSDQYPPPAIEDNGPLPLADRWVFLWFCLTSIPMLALAPLLGAIASSRLRWPVMMLSVGAGLGIVVMFTWNTTAMMNPIGVMGLLLLAGTFFTVNRLALVPDAARQSVLSLPQLHAFFAIATVGGMSAGVWIGYADIQPRGMPLQLQVGHVGFGLALLALLFGRCQPEPGLPIRTGLIGPLFRTATAIFRERLGRYALLLLWIAFTLVVLLGMWVIPPEGHLAFGLAIVMGLVFGGLHSHPFRTAGYVAYTFTAIVIAAVWGMITDSWYGPGLFMSAMVGWMIVPLLTIYQVYQPEQMRGHGVALLLAGCGLIGIPLGLLPSLYPQDLGKLHATARLATLILGIAGALLSWLVLFRPTLELTAELVLSLMYRITIEGPGVPKLPWRGPCLVIANHAAWFDPLWIAKCLPMPTTPMMTSRFYDLPVIRWLMRKIVGTIRVPDVGLRKNAPEIQEAIAAIDRGECVVIFPEGWLRRKQEIELRRFGRGVWQILAARPQTPVFACWIEGGWGSYFSYFNGPPTKNKKIDIRRHIKISVAEPRVLDAATLASHLDTRSELMKSCLEARSYLALPPFDPNQLPETEEDETPAHLPEHASQPEVKESGT